MNHSPEECQPCDDFRSEGQFNIHECFAPVPGTTDRCATFGGTVAFCSNCCHDHHEGGYNTCKGSWHSTGEYVCARNHPLCLKANEERKTHPKDINKLSTEDYEILARRLDPQ